MATGGAGDEIERLRARVRELEAVLGPACVRCGAAPIDPGRRGYAEPTCLACLPPPDALPLNLACAIPRATLVKALRERAITWTEVGEDGEETFPSDCSARRAWELRDVADEIERGEWPKELGNG